MRARSIKPAFFKNEGLAALDFGARLLFIGLWCLADREGKLEDRPLRIKAEIFPYDGADVAKWLDDLCREGFITRYEAASVKCIQIVNFLKHQTPYHKEQSSVLPNPNQLGSRPEQDRVITALTPDSPFLTPDSSKIGQQADRFPEFWRGYPKKVKKQDAQKVWKSRRLDSKADEIIQDVKDRLAEDGRWLNGFVPDPPTYLRGSRWEDEFTEVIRK